MSGKLQLLTGRNQWSHLWNTSALHGSGNQRRISQGHAHDNLVRHQHPPHIHTHTHTNTRPKTQPRGGGGGMQGPKSRHHCAQSETRNHSSQTKLSVAHTILDEKQKGKKGRSLLLNTLPHEFHVRVNPTQSVSRKGHAALLDATPHL